MPSAAAKKAATAVDKDGPPKKKGRVQDRYGMNYAECLEYARKYIVTGVNNTKFNKESNDMKAIEAIVRANSETEAALREEVYSRPGVREALQHQIRSAESKCDNICIIIMLGTQISPFKPCAVDST